MRRLYSLLIQIAGFHLWIAQVFSKKLKLFVGGRQDVFVKIRNKISDTDKTIWFHCASLGEYEQGVPIMNGMKKLLPSHKIVVSFFSPSGYEIKKNSTVADLIVYLPLDTRQNAKEFIELVHPSLAIFVKYEIWPNYLFELETHKIPTILVSGLFRSKQIFFKPLGGFMRKALRTFDHVFVQGTDSKDLLSTINIRSVTVSGDTRFDRVSHQIEQDNSLEFMEEFKGSSLCVVCGSTWPEDESVLLNFMNTTKEDVKFVIAPHKIDMQKIDSFRRKLKNASILYSEIVSPSKSSDNKDHLNASILIVDSIGLLTKIYSYADIAYVGGAMGTTGLHNILEPATFGVPIVIGNNFEAFPEANKLQKLAGLFAVTNEQECSQILMKLVQDSSFRSKTGMITEHFINSNTGATKKILTYIEELHRDSII